MLIFFLTLTSMVVVYFCIVYHMWHIKYFHETSMIYSFLVFTDKTTHLIKTPIPLNKKVCPD